MTRRGLFKMLAATPLAGIVAKFAPKPIEMYWRGTPYNRYAGIKMRSFWEVHEEWLKQPPIKYGDCKWIESAFRDRIAGEETSV